MLNIILILREQLIAIMIIILIVMMTIGSRPPAPGAVPSAVPTWAHVSITIIINKYYYY